MILEISIHDIENVYIGNAEDIKGGTGVTAIIAPDGAPCGVCVAGGGPASRETTLLDPRAAAEGIHAVVLSGGSAFGLDASGGVMKYLEEKGIGFDTGITKVPLVCQSSIFDLGVGDKNSRPDVLMGYRAAENAFRRNYNDGCTGGGTGATVGKMRGADFMMKSGIGSYCIKSGNIKVGAVVIVNALGDVYDEKGSIIAGMLNDEKNGFLSSEKMITEINPPDNLFTGNTTIGAVITNACFDKSKMNKIAAMAQNGVVRSIRPINTSADGDSLYAMSAGTQKASADAVGTLAAIAVQKAVIKAVSGAQTMFGAVSCNDFKNNAF